MNKEEYALLEKAVVNLTIENAKLKEQLEKKTESADMWWNFYTKEKKRAESAEAQLKPSSQEIEEVEKILSE